MDDIYIFETACGVENKHLVVRVDPAIFDQTAQRCHTSGAFGTEKNAFGFSNPRNFGQHLVIPDAHRRTVALSDRL